MDAGRLFVFPLHQNEKGEMSRLNNVAVLDTPEQAVYDATAARAQGRMCTASTRARLVCLGVSYLVCILFSEHSLVKPVVLGVY